MSNAASVNWRQYTEVRVDWRAFALVALFLAVIGGALLARPWLIGGGTESAVAGTSTAEQAGGGFAWALAEAAFAGLLLALLYFYRRTPGWMQTVIGRTIRVGFWIAVAFYAAATLGGFYGLIGVSLIFAAVETLKEWDLYWIANNALALAIAIGAGALIGIKFGPVVVATGLIGLSVYDHWFADRKDWMFSLAGWMVRWKLPAMVIFPTALRFEWDRMLDAEEEDTTPEDINFGFGIGMADLLLPAALAVGVAGMGGGLPVAGVVAGTVAACFRLSHKINVSGGAGLPALTVGALAGWAVASLAAISLLGGV